MNESSGKAGKGFYPNTELGIDLKLMTKEPGRMVVGEYLDGAITNDGEDHFTFVLDALFVACAHRARQLEFSIRPARSISLRRGRGLRRRHHECRGRRPACRRNDFGGIEP